MNEHGLKNKYTFLVTHKKSFRQPQFYKSTKSTQYRGMNEHRLKNKYTFTHHTQKELHTISFRNKTQKHKNPKSKI